MKWKWLRRRLYTLGLYVLVVIGAAAWAEPGLAWWHLLLRLGTTAVFLFAAVYSTVTIWHEDHGQKLSAPGEKVDP